MIWLREIWRSKLKFGLLALAVGLLFFLLLFVNTLSTTLLDRFVGAVENNSADLLVFQADAQSTVQASRLSADDVARVADVPGVAATGPIAVIPALTQLGAGRVRALAVTSASATPRLPGVPPLSSASVRNASTQPIR